MLTCSRSAAESMKCFAVDRHYLGMGITWHHWAMILRKRGQNCSRRNQLLVICLRMVNEAVFTIQLLLSIPLIKHICCAAEHGGQLLSLENFHYKWKLKLLSFSTEENPIESWHRATPGRACAFSMFNACLSCGWVGGWRFKPDRAMLSK